MDGDRGIETQPSIDGEDLIKTISKLRIGAANPGWLRI